MPIKRENTASAIVFVCHNICRRCQFVYSMQSATFRYVHSEYAKQDFTFYPTRLMQFSLVCLPSRKKIQTQSDSQFPTHVTAHPRVCMTYVRTRTCTARALLTKNWQPNSSTDCTTSTHTEYRGIKVLIFFNRGHAAARLLHTETRKSTLPLEM